MTDLASLSPDSQAKLCEHLHRNLLASPEGKTAVGCLHSVLPIQRRLGFAPQLSVVVDALVAMHARGSVQRYDGVAITIWRAVPSRR